VFTSRIGLLGRTAIASFVLLAAAGGEPSLASARLAAAEPAKESKPADVIAALHQAQIALAQKGYAAAVEKLARTEKSGERLVWQGKPEEVYRWSLTWLQAQRDLGPKPEERVAALEGHLGRMTELKKRIGELDKDLVPRRDEFEVERYRIEAELWLAKANAEYPTVRLIQPQVRRISGSVGQPGYLAAWEQTAIRPKATGYVKKWNVDIGDKVQKGQVLAALDAPELVEEWETKKAQVDLAVQRIELAKGTVEAREADVKEAEARVEESRALLKAKGPADAAGAVVARAEAELLGKKVALAQAKVAVAVAKSEMKMAQGEARRLKAQVDYLTLTAPYDGIIVVRNVNTGDLVSCSEAEPLFVVARMDVLRFFVQVPQEFGYSVRVGTKAILRIPALDEIRTTVSRTGTAFDPKSRTLRAEIDLPNPDGKLLPGMYASAEVLLERPRVRALPLSAIERSGSRTFFWAHQNGRAVRMEVRRGVGDGKWVEVSGRRPAASRDEEDWEEIDGSEQVILGDLSVLTEGKAVRVAKPQASP
jgi:HlyD family secretion protein